MEHTKKTTYTKADFVAWGKQGGDLSVKQKLAKGTLKADLARAREIKKAKSLTKPPTE